MLTDYFSCYKLNNKSTAFLEENDCQKTTLRLSNFLCNQSFGVFKHWCLLISKRKKYFLIFYTCIPENVRAYHTGSALTQHYYVCRVLIIYIFFGIRYNEICYNKFRNSL